MKKRISEEKIRRENELYEEIKRQEAKPKRRVMVDTSHNDDSYSVESPPVNMNHLQSNEEPPIHSNFDDFGSPPRTDRSDYNNSPSKPARARLISDVYGSAGIVGGNVMNQGLDDNKWRPSGKNVDDKAKAAQAEMKVLLDKQRQDDIRRKEEEKKRIQDEDLKLEEKLREIQEQEELRKRKIEDQKRHQEVLQ